MIKVLKSGKRKKIKCNKCKSVLSYEPEDVMGHLYDDDHASWEKYIICPLCHNIIIIEEGHF